MDYFLIEFGKKIKGFRELKSYSQEKLAELVGVAVNTISLWETGKSFIEYPTLVKLCNALDIEIGELFCFPTQKGDTPFEQIVNKISKLSPIKQKQILEIIKTFE